MTAFADYLINHANLPTYLDVVPAGNNGDELIRRGTLHALRRANVHMVADPAESKHIIVRGHGSFTDFYDNGALKEIEAHCLRFPDCRITIGPSTFAYDRVRADLVLSRCVNDIVWFARDRYSFDKLAELRRLCRVEPKLSDDCALELSDSEYILELRKRCQENHVLIALRKDKEGKGGILAHTHGRWLPRQVRAPLSQLRDRFVARRSRDTVDTALDEFAHLKNLPRMVRDISVSMSYIDFESAVTNAALIITDRLHVGLFGHLLGKHVVLQEGNYFKIRAIYELSLYSCSNVRLISG